MSRKAFTLIELLVVIAIIAILAAILFPVFAQAKLAAKKTRGLAHTKQIGTSLNIYLGDSDDTLIGYRWSNAVGTAPINPYYLSLPAGSPIKARYEADGQRTMVASFFNQMLQPYMKSDDMFNNQENPEGWVNNQTKDLPADAGFFAYGGQNSYAANNYLLKSNMGTSATSVEGPSDTLVFVDATYYNALPAQPISGLCKLNGVAPRAGNDDHYWKHLGNNEFDFNNRGVPDPRDPSNAQVIRNIENRYGGVVNVVRVDSSAKSLQAKAVINNLRDKGRESYWNPLKTDCEL